jgi:predicted transcriptional regulator
MSQRAVADLLGISHPTVGKLVKEWRARSTIEGAVSTERRRRA